jgi:pimeloyl-ACP methyl ester carboxylesterase
MDELISFGNSVDANFSFVEGAPCLIIVHGYGWDGKEAHKNWLPIFYPTYGFLRFSFRNIDNLDSMLDDLKSAIDFVEQYTSDIWLFAVSLGAIVATVLNDNRVKAMCIASSPVDSNVNINIPLLVIHGRDDEVVSVDYAYNLYNAKQCATLYIFEGTHEVWPDNVGDIVFSWFNNIRRI